MREEEVRRIIVGEEQDERTRRKVRKKTMEYERGRRESEGKVE